MRGTEWEDADDAQGDDDEAMLTWSPIRTPYDDESTWEPAAPPRAAMEPAPLSHIASAPVAADTISDNRAARLIDADHTSTARTQHVHRGAGRRMSQSRIPFFSNVIPDDAARNAALNAAPTPGGRRFTPLGSRTESAPVAAERVKREAREGRTTLPTRGTESDAGEGPPNAEAPPKAGAEPTVTPIRWRTVPMPVEVRMLDALLDGSNGLVVRCTDDPSVREVTCDDRLIVTTDDRAVFMCVTSVAKLPSEVEAWEALGNHLLLGV